MIIQGETGKTKERPEQAAKDFSFHVETLKGLGGAKKRVSSKFLYDDTGSSLFQRITELPEYYLTKAEENILLEKSAEIASLMEGSFDVVELGAGDGHKTKILLRELLSQNRKGKYFPVDISVKALEQLAQNLPEEEFGDIEGLNDDFLSGLRKARSLSKRPLLVLFLGSNIGNFDPVEREKFLSGLRGELGPEDRVLTGFDLKKNIAVMTRAYSDSEGVTRDFNLNLLARINRELGGTFDPRSFAHHAFYNPEIGAMESYLLSLREQDVWIEEFQKSFHFDLYEGIRVERSYKFTVKEIEAAALNSDFVPLRHFGAQKGVYIDSLWAPSRQRGHFH